MTRTLRSAWHSRHTAVLLATATVAASFGWALAPGPSSSAQTADPPFTVDVSQTTGLRDGDVVDVTVRTAPGTRIQDEPENDLFICRAGVSYTSLADLRATAGNCPANIGVSTSSQGQARLFTLADGSRAEGDIAVGTGIAEWSPGFGLPNATLECGPEAPCLLVVRVPASVGGQAVTEHIVAVELSFLATDENAGCGARDPAAVGSAGSDRMQELWTQSTLAQCQNAGSAGASTRFAPRGEGDALASFASGEIDLAYTAAGYRPVRGLDVSPARPAVYTPVALNAVVIATIGGGQVITDDPAWPIGKPRPYSPPIRLSAAEVATLIGKGQFFLAFDHSSDVIARNPQLSSGLYFNQVGGKYTNALAVQDPTAVSLFMTSFLDAVAPDAWVSGPATDFAPRGVDAQLGVATPGFESALMPISTQSQLRAMANVDVRQTISNPQPGWALTDYATAIKLGLQPVAIENAAGEFVLPTPESIAAGASTMTLDADGRRVPDPQATAPGAYPLTMIEYAMAPAEPLVDGVCAPRPQEQAVLSSWLSFLTGPGQASLGDGLVPLTADLAADAEASMVRVGASPSTAACTPTGPTGPAPGGPTGPGAGVTPTGASGAGGSASGSRNGGTGGAGAGLDAAALSPSTPDELAGAAELADAAEPTLPPFLGIAAVSEIISPVALLLVVVLTSGAAFLTSGRPAPPALARAGRKVSSAADTLVRRLPGVRRR
jgi:hypothetical protein